MEYTGGGVESARLFDKRSDVKDIGQNVAFNDRAGPIKDLRNNIRECVESEAAWEVVSANTKGWPKAFQISGKGRAIRCAECEPEEFPFTEHEYVRFPELRERGQPGRGGRWEIFGLMYKAMRRNDTPRRENEQELKFIRDELNSFYPKTMPPRSMLCDFDAEKLAIFTYNKIFSGKVNRNGSPGYPYMIYWKTNGAWIDNNVWEIVLLVVMRVRDRLKYAESGEKWNVKKRIANNVQDPQRVFIKDEAHTQKKLKLFKFRVIQSVSLIDSLIQRMLYDNQDNAEIDNWKTIPSSPGVGFTDEDNEIIVGKVEDMLQVGEVFGTDVSGWDESVHKHERLQDAERRIELSIVNVEGSVWQKLVRLEVEIQCSPLHITSDGVVITYSVDGGMNSGEKITSSSNSWIRNFINKLAAYRHGVSLKNMKTMSSGDDNLCNKMEGYAEEMDKMGYDIKQIDDVKETFEYCSHEYSLITRKARFLNFAKTMHQLLRTKQVDRGMIESRFNELRNNEEQRQRLMIYVREKWGY